VEAQSNDNKIMRGIFEKSKKSFVLKIMSNDNRFEIKETKEEKNSNIVEISTPDEKIENSLIERDTYPTVTNFLLVALTFIQDNKLDINPKAFMTLFDFTKSYEDNFVKITYDEDTKIGEIIKK